MEIPPGMKFFIYQVPGDNFSWGGFIAESAEAAQDIPELKKYPKGTEARVYEVTEAQFLEMETEGKKVFKDLRERREKLRKNGIIK
jgi:hypothetical protein